MKQMKKRNEIEKLGEMERKEKEARMNVGSFTHAVLRRRLYYMK